MRSPIRFSTPPTNNDQWLPAQRIVDTHLRLSVSPSLVPRFHIYVPRRLPVTRLIIDALPQINPSRVRPAP
jgi:hypothetical protein